MSDEQTQEINPQPISFVQHIVYVVEGDWPQHTLLSEDVLANPHIYHCAVDGDRVTFHAGNGEATYAVHREGGIRDGGYLAALVESTDKAQMRSLRRKFDDNAHKRTSRVRVEGR